MPGAMERAFPRRDLLKLRRIYNTLKEREANQTNDGAICVTRPLWARTTTMLNRLTTRNSQSVTTVITACCLMFVIPQGPDHLNFKPTAESELVYLASSPKAPNTSTPQPPLIASPSIEPELNDLGADLEAKAVEALKLFAAPAAEEPPEPTPKKR